MMKKRSGEKALGNRLTDECHAKLDGTELSDAIRDQRSEEQEVLVLAGSKTGFFRTSPCIQVRLVI
jgi:hypothetical protein